MKILLVDDAKSDLLIINGMLKDYDCVSAEDGLEALEQIDRYPDIGIMILDLNMPRMNGYEVLERLKSHYAGRRISTLILTNVDEVDNEIRGLDLGAIDFIRKPLNMRSLRKRIELHINLRDSQIALEHSNYTLETALAARTNECNSIRDATIQAMIGLLEIRNIESSNHSLRTQWMIKALCENMRKKGLYQSLLTDGYIAELFSTSPLHDIGKIGIPDSILLKPGKLTPEEFEIMKKHTIYGVDALSKEEMRGSSLSFIRTAIEIIGSHHEKYDGSGYPAGLKGKEIPLSGRLMAIVDVYDALVSERVYKPAFTHEQSRDIILSEKGRHFDPDVVDAFLDAEDEIRSITARFVPNV